METGTPPYGDRTPGIVRFTRGLEDATVLDGPVRALEPWVEAGFGRGARGAALRGEWLGHAIHPLLTDVVIGSWNSATVLDLFGGEHASPSARRLVAVGLLGAGPAAWTGWAEWSLAGKREKRVGVVHAVTNAAAIGVYTASWVARRRGRHGTGVRLALAGTALTSFAAYLGGHLIEVRKVASHHPAYDEPA